MNKTYPLHNDYKRTGLDSSDPITTYEIYQDLNNPKQVALAKIETISDITVETYHFTTVNNTTEFTTLWNNRASLTYYNLIDTYIKDKLN